MSTLSNISSICRRELKIICPVSNLKSVVDLSRFSSCQWMRQPNTPMSIHALQNSHQQHNLPITDKLYFFNKGLVQSYLSFFVLSIPQLKAQNEYLKNNNCKLAGFKAYLHFPIQNFLFFFIIWRYSLQIIQISPNFVSYPVSYQKPFWLYLLSLQSQRTYNKGRLPVGEILSDIAKQASHLSHREQFVYSVMSYKPAGFYFLWLWTDE